MTNNDNAQADAQAQADAAQIAKLTATVATLAAQVASLTQTLTPQGPQPRYSWQESGDVAWSSNDAQDRVRAEQDRNHRIDLAARHAAESRPGADASVTDAPMFSNPTPFELQERRKQGR